MSFSFGYDTKKFVNLESGQLVELPARFLSSVDSDWSERVNIFGREILIEKTNFVVNLRDSNGNLLCALVFLDKLEEEIIIAPDGQLQKESNCWLAVTPEGFFDGIAEAQKHILWRFTKGLFDVAPIQAFYYENYYPGSMKKVLGGEKPRLPSNASSFDLKDFRQADAM